MDNKNILTHGIHMHYLFTCSPGFEIFIIIHVTLLGIVSDLISLNH